MIRFFCFSFPLSSPQKNGVQIGVKQQGQGLFLRPYCISTIPGGHAVLGPPVPGARVERPQYGHYFSDEGLVRGRRFWLLFSLERKVTRARTRY